MPSCSGFDTTLEDVGVRKGNYAACVFQQTAFVCKICAFQIMNLLKYLMYLDAVPSCHSCSDDKRVRILGIPELVQICRALKSMVSSDISIEAVLALGYGHDPKSGRLEV